MMNTVSVSPKFQIVIPRQIREQLNIRPGQKLQAMNIGGIIELVPVMSVEEAYGFLGPMDTTVEREADREF